MANEAYKVYIGDIALDRDKELLNPNNREGEIPPEETLVSCQYTAEMSAAGSCVFVMPPTHPYISEIKPMITEVIVEETGNIVWFGRVTDTKRDFLNRLTVNCEGAYAFFNDSICLYEAYYDISPGEYLAKLLANHNAQVPHKRQIQLGYAQGMDVQISGEINYESTMSLIQKFLDDYGGYIHIRFDADGTCKLFWLDGQAAETSQRVTFGKNLLDFAKSTDFSDICTSVIPLGANVEMEIPDLDEHGNQLYEDADGEQVSVQDETHTIPSTKIVERPLNLGMTPDENVEPDEDGIAPLRFIQSSTQVASLVVNGSNATRYGRIVRSVTFDDVYDTSTLRQKASRWLDKQPFGEITIDISAADLRFLDRTQGAFTLGVGVPVYSPPHGVDVTETLFITKIEADVVKVSKKISLGNLPEKTLSDIAGRGKSANKEL